MGPWPFGTAYGRPRVEPLDLPGFSPGVELALQEDRKKSFAPLRHGVFWIQMFLFQSPNAILGVSQVLLLKSRTNVYEMSAKVSHPHALLLSLRLGNVNSCTVLYTERKSDFIEVEFTLPDFLQHETDERGLLYAPCKIHRDITALSQCTQGVIIPSLPTDFVQLDGGDLPSSQLMPRHWAELSSET